MGSPIEEMCNKSEGLMHSSPVPSSLEDWGEIATKITPKIRSWYTDFVT